jgi:hypothetical protein
VTYTATGIYTLTLTNAEFISKVVMAGGAVTDSFAGEANARTVTVHVDTSGTSAVVRAFYRSAGALANPPASGRIWVWLVCAPNVATGE